MCPQCCKDKTTFARDHACNFCGQSFCKECAKLDSKKTRAFLCGNGDKGKICRICEAKHVLRATYLPQKKQIARLDEKIARITGDDEQQLEML